jgi:CRP-like cAMP-binding protein
VQDRELLANLLQLRLFAKHEVLFRQGAEGTALYIILEGMVRISVSRGPETVTLATLGPGEFLGEMSLLDGQPHSADAEAVGDVWLYCLKREDFLSFLQHNYTAVHAILYALSIRLRKTDEQLTEMCFLNLSERLAKKLVELAESQCPETTDPPEPCSITMSQHELASILGVTRESVNKGLKTLRNKGYVSTSRKTITIRDRDSLKSLIP